ncbi:MAG: hypothetical protein JWM93_2648, partial [Frankiales bacterium]|nr:hypothetical protein [Frankiales bacterium]
MTLGGEFSSRLTFGAPPASDAAAWIQGRLQGFLWSKQLEIVQALVEHRRVAVVAGHGVGKSWLAARQVAHWIESHPVGSAFAFTSAPSQTQVSAVLFRELRRAHRAGGLRGRITGGAVPTWMIGDEMVAMGRKSADASDADQAAASLQGLHAQHMLGVIDEAGGVPEWLWSAVGSLTSSSTSRLLAIGNPAAGSHFEKVCAPGSGWHVIRVSVFDSPAFTGERVPPAVLESLVTREWVDELERDYGRDSPVFQAKALALFPETREDALISPVWLTRAHQRAGREIASGSVGLDVARSGGDRSVAYINRGGVVRRRFVHRGDDLMKTAGKLIADLRDNLHSPPVPIEAIIDITGIGAGVFDRVREVEVPAVPFVAAERARDPRRFIN